MICATCDGRGILRQFERVMMIAPDDDGGHPVETGHFREVENKCWRCAGRGWLWIGLERSDLIRNPLFDTVYT